MSIILLSITVFVIALLVAIYFYEKREGFQATQKETTDAMKSLLKTLFPAIQFNEREDVPADVLIAQNDLKDEDLIAKYVRESVMSSLQEDVGQLAPNVRLAVTSPSLEQGRYASTNLPTIVR